MVTTTTFPGLVSIDPIQGLIDYVADIKPYHTKVFETLVEYVYTDFVNVSIKDINQLAINSTEIDDIDVTFTETSITEAFDFFVTAPPPNPPATIVAADATSGVIYFAASGGNPSINLASAVTYAVIADTTITNVGSSVITGDLALFPGTSVTGFPPGTVSGTQNINNGAANTAINDATAAFVAGNALVGATVLSASTYDFAGGTISPGLYKIGSGATITTGVTLDAGGNPNATFIFQIGSTLTIPTSSIVTLAGGAQAKNVYWLVGSSASFAGVATFNGTIIAQASISMASGGTVTGHLFALTGAVTFGGSGETVTATPAGSGPSPPTNVSVQPGDILNISGSSGNDGNYDVLTVGYDAQTNEIAVTLNMVPVTNPATEGTATFFHTDTTYAFQLTILSVANPGPTITDPASPVSFTTPIFVVKGNATRAIQPGSVFRVQGSTVLANNSSQENTYPITSIYYAVYVNFIPGLNPDGSRNPLLDTSIIGVGPPPGSTGLSTPAPFILPVSQGTSGYIIPYNITGYDSRYDGPYDRMAGYQIISG